MPARLYLLGVGTFTIGTTTYLITSLLPAISSELGVTASVAGQLSTVFALAYAIAAPLVATVTGRWDRRTLLVAALLIVTAGNVIAAVAPTFGILMLGRVITALGAAAFTPTATLVATGLMPVQQRGRAIAIVFGGLTVALAIGVPAGGILGPILGFRGVHAMIAVLGAAIAIASWRTLPSVPAPPPVSLRDRLTVAADRRAITVLVMSVVGVVATMTIYVYLVPLLGATAGAKGVAITVLLLVYGIGAMIGNNIGGRASDRFGSRAVLLVVLIGFSALVLSLPISARTVVGAGVVLLAWGVFTWAFNPPIQSLLVQIGGERAGLLVSLNASAIYLGAGIGGALGGLVINLSGPLTLPFVSGGLSVVGLVLGLTLILGRNKGRSSEGDREKVVSRAA